MKDIMDLLGRALMSIIFFFEAYDKIFFMGDTKHTMTRLGTEWSQNWLLHNQNNWIYAVGFCLILGASLILIGYRVGFGVFLILAYWLPLTFMLNQFWDYPYAHEARRGVALHFMVRSTRVPTAERLAAPLMRSPSQWPGISRPSISSGLAVILTSSVTKPRRSLPRDRGRRFWCP